MIRRLVPLLLVSQFAHAEPIKLRMAAIAPDGTSWARELKAWARAVEIGSGGEVRAKWYLGGIAGDEPTAISRVRRDQLDGAAGALMCEQLAPTLRVMRVPGLIQSRDEALHVLNALQPDITAEMTKSGFAYLGVAGFGLDVLFTRKPVANMAELRATNFWIRPYDDVLSSTLTRMGLKLSPLPLEDAGRAYEEGRVDGFIASPASGLSFQWASRSRAFTDVKMAYLVACLVIATRTMDRLPVRTRDALANESAKLAARFEEVGRDFDHQLLGSLFARQGLQRIEPSAQFKRELATAELEARKGVDPALVTPPLLKRVSDLVDAFRRTEKQKPR
jgi:TRAP-type C4-dicarboxylate transport system substrate-binding protein